MASDKSYEITLNNNLTEKEAINYVMSQDKNLCNPTKESRKELLEMFNLPKSFSRAFDLIHVPQHHNRENILNLSSKNDITFVELKTTKKPLPNIPKGFFFGATENEFNLAEKLGDQYIFCFVSLHPETKSYAYKSLSELNSLIKTKRIQYQINLVK